MSPQKKHKSAMASNLASRSENLDNVKDCGAELWSNHSDGNESQVVKWYYAGYKGWWVYDPRTAKEIERMYQIFTNKSKNSCEQKTRRHATVGEENRDHDQS